MDDRVNCMACLVADETGMLLGSVAVAGGVTHALARTGGARQTAHHLCAFDFAGTIRDGRYWSSRVDEEDVVRRAIGPLEGAGPQPAAHDDVEADALAPSELGEDWEHDGREAYVDVRHRQHDR
jgi:hypothetical protein